MPSTSIGGCGCLQSAPTAQLIDKPPEHIAAQCGPYFAQQIENEALEPPEAAIVQPLVVRAIFIAVQNRLPDAVFTSTRILPALVAIGQVQHKHDPDD